ncbi:hypothetical protein QYF36_018489 [Acer negundo]|nr:hypothetical protein QYF36_018489 [Acer negundo]
MKTAYGDLNDMSYLTNGYLNTVIDWIPGMEGIRLKDLPTFIRTTDADDIKLNFAIGEVENARNASALLFNTIDDLENEVLEALYPTNPPIFTIGPLQLLLDQIPHEDALSSIKSNLWKEQAGKVCLLRESEEYKNHSDMSYLTNGYLNTVIDWIPGMEGIRLKDLPTFIRTTDADDMMVNFAMGDVENARNASALLFNTIDNLEHEVLEALSPTYPPIFAIGPLQLLLDQIPPEDALSPIKSNLWKEQEYNHKRLLRSRGPDSLKGTPSFCFETIPDGLPPSDADATQDVPSLFDSTKKTCLAPFRELLSRLNNTCLSNVPPVTCIVSDCTMSFTLIASQELNIPNVLFWTASACGFMGYLQYRSLIEKGLVPLKAEALVGCLCLGGGGGCCFAQLCFVWEEEDDFQRKH